MLGKVAWNKGKKLTTSIESTNKRIQNILKVRQNTDYKIANSVHNKSIYKINTISGEITEYKSIVDCSIALNKQRNHINRYLSKSITQRQILKNGYILSFDKNDKLINYKEDGKGKYERVQK